MTNPNTHNIIKPLRTATNQACSWASPDELDPKVKAIYDRCKGKGQVLVLEEKRDFDAKKGWFIYAILYRMYVSKANVKYVVQVGDKVTEEKDPEFKQIVCKHDFACAGWIIEDIENPE